MNRELIFYDVISRAKEVFGCKTDKDFADVIGIKPQTLGNRKKTASIPYDEIVAAAIRQTADIQYILTGMRSHQVAEESPGYAVLDKREAALIENYRHIADEEDKRCVERTALLAAKADKKEGTNG
jgi:hypothetical protein